MSRNSTTTPVTNIKDDATATIAKVFGISTAAVNLIWDLAAASFKPVGIPPTSVQEFTNSLTTILRLISAIVFLAISTPPASLAVVVLLSPKLTDFIVRMYRHNDNLFTPTEIFHRIRYTVAYIAIGIVFWTPKFEIVFQWWDYLMWPSLYGVYSFFIYGSLVVATIILACWMTWYGDEKTAVGAWKMVGYVASWGLALAIISFIALGIVSGIATAIWMQFYPFLGSGIFTALQNGGVASSSSSKIQENLGGYWATGAAFIIKLAFDLFEMFGPQIISLIWHAVYSIPKDAVLVGHWCANGNTCKDFENRKLFQKFRVTRVKGTHIVKMAGTTSNRFSIIGWGDVLLELHRQELDGQLRFAAPYEDWLVQPGSYRHGASEDVPFAGKRLYQVLFSKDVLAAFNAFKMSWIWLIILELVDNIKRYKEFFRPVPVSAVCYRCLQETPPESAETVPLVNPTDPNAPNVFVPPSYVPYPPQTKSVYETEGTPTTVQYPYMPSPIQYQTSPIYFSQTVPLDTAQFIHPHQQNLLSKSVQNQNVYVSNPHAALSLPPEMPSSTNPYLLEIPSINKPIANLHTSIGPFHGQQIPQNMVIPTQPIPNSTRTEDLSNMPPILSSEGFINQSLPTSTLIESKPIPNLPTSDESVLKPPNTEAQNPASLSQPTMTKISSEAQKPEPISLPVTNGSISSTTPLTKSEIAIEPVINAESGIEDKTTASMVPIVEVRKLLQSEVDQQPATLTRDTKTPANPQTFAGLLDETVESNALDQLQETTDTNARFDSKLTEKDTLNSKQIANPGGNLLPTSILTFPALPESDIEVEGEEDATEEQRLIP
ncbi:hypothetical protein HK098_001317 [Nowakowskiella sp. JEL0407]|nr:hypothetical protein HK098_001317 [Nowakowskiella sp. JEL0407]